jgi:hypothetical protein
MTSNVAEEFICLGPRSTMKEVKAAHGRMYRRVVGDFELPRQWYDAVPFESTPLLWEVGQYIRQFTYHVIICITLDYLPFSSHDHQLIERYRNRISELATVLLYDVRQIIIFYSVPTPVRKDKNDGYAALIKAVRNGVPPIYADRICHLIPDMRRNASFRTRGGDLRPGVQEEHVVEMLATVRCINFVNPALFGNPPKGLQRSPNQSRGKKTKSAHGRFSHTTEPSQDNRSLLPTHRGYSESEEASMPGHSSWGTQTTSAGASGSTTSKLISCQEQQSYTDYLEGKLDALLGFLDQTRQNLDRSRSDNNRLRGRIGALEGEKVLMQRFFEGKR